MDELELMVLSYGIGQDSWTLLVKWAKDPDFRRQYPAKRFLVICSETGNEHPETYLHLEYTKAFCRENGIEFVHIVPEMGFHAPGWQYLEHIWQRKNVIGSKAFPKTCTDQLKIQPLYRFLESWIGREYGLETGKKSGYHRFAEKYGKIGVMIGFTKGEEGRVAGEPPEAWRRKAIQMIYPLIDAGLDRAACQEYLRAAGEPVPLPSNCMMCCWMNKIELLWLSRTYPEAFTRWAEHEQRKLAANAHKGEKNLGVFGKRTLIETLQEAEEKYGHWTPAELTEYRMSHGHCVMSKY